MSYYSIFFSESHYSNSSSKTKEMLLSPRPIIQAIIWKLHPAVNHCVAEPIFLQAKRYNVYYLRCSTAEQINTTHRV